MSALTHTITVKWNKNVYPISFSPSNGVDTLLQTIQDETGVPKERAKVRLSEEPRMGGAKRRP